jgi:outer membrane biosynthesis protein TonB
MPADLFRPNVVATSSRRRASLLPVSIALHASPKLVRAGGLIQPPRKIKNVAPIYPTNAQSLRVQGKVILEALIGLDGRVDHVPGSPAVALLTDPAVSAVRQWVLTPTNEWGTRAGHHDRHCRFQAAVGQTRVTSPTRVGMGWSS